MANIDDTSTGYNWETEGVYQIEKNDPVEGGVDGISNRQARQLARRTRDLHQRLTSLKTQADGIIEQIEGGNVDTGYDTLLKLQNKLRAVENAINGDNGDSLIETLQEALGFINSHKGEIESLVNTYVKKTSIADNLTTTDATYVLSAKQGKTLKDLIDGLNTAVTNLTNNKVDKVNGKGLSTNDYTNDEKNQLAALAARPFAHAAFDYVVDSNAKLAALNGMTGITSVLIKKGTWTYNSTNGLGIVLSAGVQMVWGEPGSKVVVNGLYGGSVSAYVGALGFFTQSSGSNTINTAATFFGVTLEANSKLATLDDGAMITGFMGVGNLVNCRSTSVMNFNCNTIPDGTAYVAFSSFAYAFCKNLTGCSGVAIRNLQGTPGTAYSNCKYGFGVNVINLTDCTDESVADAGSAGNKLPCLYGAVGVHACTMKWIRNSRKVLGCTAVGYDISYAAAASSSTYPCADTPNGGFNSIG